MVLLAVADHKYRIEVGYGLEGILPDGKIGDIGRDMVPDLRAGDYDGAVTLAVGEVAQVIAADANVTLDNAPAPATEPAPQHQSAGSDAFGGIILTIFVLVFIFRVLGSLASLACGAWASSRVGAVAVAVLAAASAAVVSVAAEAVVVSVALAAVVEDLAAAAPEEAGNEKAISYQPSAFSSGRTVGSWRDKLIAES